MSTRERLFEVMRCDICTMAEWGDDENELRDEVMNCDMDILRTYCETFDVDFCD